MQFVTYKGAAGNLGRFGHVEPGQPLVLSDQEFAMVKGDKRFAPNKDPETSTQTSNPTLNSANNPDHVAVLELNQMTRAQLLDKVAELQKEGHKIEIGQNAKRDAILHALTPFVTKPIETAK